MLTDEQVTTIRRDRKRGVSWKDLVRRYGIPETTVRKAGLGLSYRHVMEPPASYDLPPAQRDPDPMFQAALEGLTWEEAKRRAAR